MISPSFYAESTPIRTSDVDYRLLEASKAGDLETVKVGRHFNILGSSLEPLFPNSL